MTCFGEFVGRQVVLQVDEDSSCCGISLTGGKSGPLVSLHRVFDDAGTCQVHAGHLALRVWVVLCGTFAEPLGGLGCIFGNFFSVEVDVSQSHL